MIAAVLEKHARLAIAVNDIYLSTVGGMRLTEPSADLAVAIALASAYANLPLPTTAVMIGEVGLAGDIRRVNGMARRLSEAARQGSPSPWSRPVTIRCRPVCTRCAHPPSSRRCSTWSTLPTTAAPPSQPRPHIPGLDTSH